VRRPVEVQGHRGARALLPENTLVGFDYALSVGVDTLELDLVATRDDHLVVSHDLMVDPGRCTQPDGSPVTFALPIRSLELARVQRYDCGRLRHPAFPRQRPVPGQHMPSLSEVLALVTGSSHPAAKRVRLNLELKSLPARPELTPAPEEYAGLLVRLVRAHGLVDRAVVQSFDHRLLQAVERLAPELPRAVLMHRTLPDLVAVARAVGAGIVSPNHEWITAPEVERLHAAGLRVVPWTVNVPGEWDRLLGMGVDGIITDDPAGLIGHLKARGLR